MTKDIRTTRDIAYLLEELQRYRELKDSINVAVIEWRLKEMGH